MKFLRRLTLALFALAMTPAAAQTWVPAPVSNSWSPAGTSPSASQSVTSASAAQALPGNLSLLSIADVCNVGSSDAYVAVGGSGIVATTSSALVKAGTCLALSTVSLGAQASYLAAITASSTTTLRIETGYGTPSKDQAGGAGSAVTCSACATETTLSAFKTANHTDLGLLATATAQTTGNTNTGNIATNTSTTATNTGNIGAPGSTVCATDTGPCNENALLQRLAQRLTTLIGTTAPPATQVYSGNVTNTAIAMNASPTKMTSYAFTNNNSTVCYIQLWDLAQGSVTVGTTAPKFSIGIPANGGANLALRYTFATALTGAATTTRANSTACTSGVDVNLFQE